MTQLRDYATLAVYFGYQLVAVWTFLYLTFFDGYVYTWWRLPIALVANSFAAFFWPLYWLILRHLF